MSEVHHEQDQCPVCGRLGYDWANRPAGETKGKTKEGAEDRASAYRDWRHTFGHGCYVMDIDQVEWRIIDGVPTPIAIIELSRVDGNVHLPKSYMEAVLHRFNKRDGQGSMIKEIAQSLKVKAWVVLFRWDLTEFWVYNLTDSRGWWQMNQEKYEGWVRKLKLSRQ